MLNCISCQAEIAEHYKFCPVCGQPQDRAAVVTPQLTEEVTIKVCPQCGDENEAEFAFCQGCGVSIGNVIDRIIKRTVPTAIEAPAEIKTVNETKKNLETPVQPKRPVAQEKNKQKKTAQPNNPVEVVKANPNKPIVLLAVAMFVLAAVILIVSGVFDSHEKPVPEVSSEQSTAPAAKGVNLAAVNAINELEKSVKAQPENLEQMLQLAHMLNDAGFFDRAIAYYKLYLGKNPASPEVIIDMGVCFFSLQNYDKADSIMRTALKLAPNHPIGLYNLGIVNMSKGNMPEAKKWFELVIKVHPGSAQAEQAKQILESHKIN
ncbi:MAG: zinc ribbon domain-containing protein [Ignavibacteriales bacterium]|nr:zinc ribbon domain-containing protein [Ignavibacteriales bacterium]